MSPVEFFTKKMEPKYYILERDGTLSEKFSPFCFRDKIEELKRSLSNAQGHLDTLIEAYNKNPQDLGQIGYAARGISCEETVDSIKNFKDCANLYIKTELNLINK